MHGTNYTRRQEWVSVVLQCWGYVTGNGQVLAENPQAFEPLAA